MDDFTDTLTGVMEQAAISGLCRDGQMEIVIQEAHKIDPNICRDDLIELAERIYGILHDSI